MRRLSRKPFSVTAPNRPRSSSKCFRLHKDDTFLSSEGSKGSPLQSVRWLFSGGSTSPLPPPEWIEPFNDVSDLVKSSRSLKPSPWVSQILNLLDGSESMESNLDAFCRKFLIKLSPSFVSFVLRSDEVVRERGQQHVVAWRFFNWAGKQKKYTHNLECYVSLVDVLAMEKDVDRIKSLCRELRKMEFALSVGSANELIKSFGKLGMVEELLWVWRKMKENGIEPTLYTYNFLMNGLVSSMFVDSAERVFEVMESGRIKPDVVTYNTMIKGYCKAGRTQRAVEKVRDMETRGLEADKITYMTVIQACYADSDFSSCVALYQEMDENGLEVPSHAYSLVIGGLCKEGKLNEGYAVFESMIRKGVKPNVAVYTVLIDGYVKFGSVEDALRLLERMMREGFEPDVVTYSVVVNGLCKNGRVEEALGYFEACRFKGLAINSMFYSSLIDGLGKAGRVDEAERLFEEMSEKGCTRDSYCYNALIDAFTKCGKVDEALALFKRMEEEEGCDQTVYTYTILISGMFKERRNEEALKLWEMMIDKGITPTAACFRALSTGLCLSGKVGRACKILDELAPMGVILDAACEDMINTLCKAGRIKEACKLADGITERGREVPGRIRTVMINALRKVGKSDLAMKLMHSKIGIGYERMGSIKRRVKFRTLLDSFDHHDF
ncbi:Pentatricopeptide repeat-containing protein [Raphanus sativus]|uniref:Pentatricopeptide repeat-containing protein At1g03560, mitochondrial n=1 Tax=Raphanus sativus TaxID=3726 RepID=A0A6J0P3J5_RAPSA|nr:pentatricopeptide repeat-containing protein At1g03560, mitochondrial [Raphanus sativus]KAJ4869779.1 Pentatricopeptide repeat-containing protein [Raphanus sativus]